MLFLIFHCVFFVFLHSRLAEAVSFLEKEVRNYPWASMSKIAEGVFDGDVDSRWGEKKNETCASRTRPGSQGKPSLKAELLEESGVCKTTHGERSESACSPHWVTFTSGEP